MMDDKYMEAEFALMRKEVEEAEKQQDLLNQSALEFVKANINYPFDYIDMSDLGLWSHIGYVEMEKTDYKCGCYPSYDFYVEKDNVNSLKYMKQDEDGEYHNMVWQTTGCCEDDYSGFLLFPLADGRYWKISYSC